VVLNRPFEGLIGSLYSFEMLPHALVPFVECRMFRGGDVDTETYISFLHTCDDLKSSSTQIQPGYYSLALRYALTKL
jgi:hypothetical protein